MVEQHHEILLSSTPRITSANKSPSPLWGGARGGSTSQGQRLDIYFTPNPSPSCRRHASGMRGGEFCRRVGYPERSAIERGAHG
jgi:hypothetical protein